MADPVGARRWGWQAHFAGGDPSVNVTVLPLHDTNVRRAPGNKRVLPNTARKARRQRYREREASPPPAGAARCAGKDRHGGHEGGMKMADTFTI
jgi:hypothetical protein